MLHTNGGINRILALLGGDLTHIAVGNSLVPVTASSTTLSSEYERNPVSEMLFDGNILIKETFFDETKANGTITEIGIFGDGAANTLGTGKLFASFRPDPALVKDSTKSLTVSIEVEVVEVTS